jgi:hypothetical protein
MEPGTQDRSCDEWPPLVRAIFEDDRGAVLPAVAGGEDPNGEFAGMRLIELAAYHGGYEVLDALIRAGANVPSDALKVLGEMDITDNKIDPIERELDYARVARILLDHGATPDVPAYNGRPLIETFPECYYPQIHRVLAGGKDSRIAPPDRETPPRDGG